MDIWSWTASGSSMIQGTFTSTHRLPFVDADDAPVDELTAPFSVAVSTPVCQLPASFCC